MNLKKQTYLKISEINLSNFFTKGVSEPKTAKIVKSVKVWSPPSQLPGRKMANSWYPKIFESKISILHSGEYKYNHQKCVSKTILHHMRPKAQKYSKIRPKVYYYRQNTFNHLHTYKQCARKGKNTGNGKIYMYKGANGG